MNVKYSKQFREEAVRLALDSESSMAQVAKDLGVNTWTLRGWIKDHREKTGANAPGKPESLEEENIRLKRELALLRQERDLLKKAAAYFAKEQL